MHKWLVLSAKIFLQCTDTHTFKPLKTIHAQIKRFMNAFLMQTQIFLVLNIYTRNPKTRVFKRICVFCDINMQTAKSAFSNCLSFVNSMAFRQLLGQEPVHKCIFFFPSGIVCSQSDVSLQTAALNFTNFQCVSSVLKSTESALVSLESPKAPPKHKYISKNKK